ncbi:hypothetical protein ACI2LC_28035 [Nonomuraea wenchangensis]|uniref:hypothetical protein n=1 Tax=Nonomuraea wenchangensis TaxID=568860 RepID=UPI003405645A
MARSQSRSAAPGSTAQAATPPVASGPPGSYGSVSALSNAFKRRIGVSPRDYRRRARPV